MSELWAFLEAAWSLLELALPVWVVLLVAVVSGAAGAVVEARRWRQRSGISHWATMKSGGKWYTVRETHRD